MTHRNHLYVFEMRTVAALTCCLLALVFEVADARDNPVLVGTVTKIVDGDTIDVQLSSGPIRVRLHGVRPDTLFSPVRS